MQDVKVVIFDWDGTVMDSIGKIVNSVRIAAERLALPVPSEFEAKQIIGLSLDPAFKTLFPASSVAERELLSEHYKMYTATWTGLRHLCLKEPSMCSVHCVSAVIS